MMTRRNWMAVLLVLTAAALTCGLEAEQSSSGLVGPAAICDVYAAVNGTATAAGSNAQPWDLQTALNQPAALTPGNTLCLRGGTFTGLFVSNLNGAAGNKITVRSAPGEWAVLDGYVHSTLTADIAANAKTIPVVDASTFPSTFAVGASIGTNVFQVYGRTGNDLKFYIGTLSAHPQGAEIVARGPALTVNGSHVIVRDFEILNSNPLRTNTDEYSRALGLYMYAPESQMLNLVIHDTGQGLGFWQQASNSIACGNLLYNNGVNGKGHGVYTQNDVGTKRLCDNITFGNFGLGMQMYTTNGGTQIGFTWDGNINVNNRYLFGGQKPIDDLTISNNFLYGATLELGYGDSGPHGRATVTGNYVYAEFPLVAKNWAGVTVTGNKLYQMSPNSGGAVLRVDLPVGGLIVNYTFTNNDYLFGRDWQDAPFRSKLGADAEIGYQFPAWQTFTNDNTSTYRGATWQLPTRPQPTGVDVLYRPNAYESGRGHVVVYNHDGAAQVSIDLAKVGLAIGQAYQVRNGQNYLSSPVVTGTYSGGSVSVPLSGLTVAQPLTDNGEHNAETPKFSVLVVVPMPTPLTLTVTSVVTESRYTVSGNPPDGSGGWRVQFKRDGVNFGIVDATAPYTREGLLPNATYTFTGVWTKPGQQTIITQPFVIEVK